MGLNDNEVVDSSRRRLRSLQRWLTFLLPASLFAIAVACTTSASNPPAAVEAAPTCHTQEAAVPNSATGWGFIDYWTGGGTYMPRIHCMVNAQGGTDWPWVVTVMLLTSSVVVSYLVIFRMWRKCYFAEEARDRNKQLMTLAYIFLFCAICGYVLSVVSFVWPAYRLLAACLVVLNIFSWRFALNSREFQTAFRAKRVERELNESLQQHNQVLTRTVEERTRDLRETIGRLDSLAKTDTLTGLANRAGLGQAIATLSLLHESAGQRLGVMFLDFDRFKFVNDSLGHDAGDALLCDAAARLRGCIAQHLGARAHCARLGGDEFVIVMGPLDNVATMTELADRIHARVAEPFEIKGMELRTRVSIGMTTSDVSGYDADALMRDADLAMYEAKSRGRGRSFLFDQPLRDAVSRRVQIEHALRAAVSGNELSVHYQPIMSLTTGNVVAFEALLRWTHPQLGAISPGEFIPIAEESGQIERITWYVVDQVISVARAAKSMVSDAPYFNINIPPLLLRRDRFAATLTARLEELGVSPAQICVEVTESGFMRDPSAMSIAVKGVRDAGMRVAMDDFGTGHSSLASLHEIAIDVLKIDRRFIASMTERREYAAVVHAITSLARNLGMEVVAEGIETREQVAQLQALDCDFAQGFLFARPMPTADALNFLKKSNGTSLAA